MQVSPKVVSDTSDRLGQQKAIFVHLQQQWAHGAGRRRTLTISRPAGQPADIGDGGLGGGWAAEILGGGKAKEKRSGRPWPPWGRGEYVGKCCWQTTLYLVLHGFRQSEV